MDSLRKRVNRYYRKLLGLYPEDFAAEYGSEMQALFRERSRSEPLPRLLWDTTVDALKTAPKEHYDMLIKDIRYALRTMAQNPGFTLVAVLSLALGIGANSAIFSLADAVLLRPMTVPRTSEVVVIRGARSGTFNFEGVSHLDYVDLRDRNRSFQGLAAMTLVPFGFAEKPDVTPQMKMGLLVSGNFFETLQIQPALGRGFRPEEDQVPGRDAVVVLSHDTWKNSFGQAADVIGRRIRLNGVEFTVIGVAPESFTGVDSLIRPALYVPVHMSPRLAGNPDHNLLVKRDNRGLELRGRLRPEVTAEAAEADLNSIGQGLAQQYPDTNRNHKFLVRSQLRARVEQSPPDAQLVTMLMLLVALVLLIACANVASLLLSRARSRSREIAIRLAVGAGRTRLVRQLLTESLLLAVFGGVLGLGFAWLAQRFFEQIQIPADIPIVIQFRMDQRMLLFSFAAALASALIFGLIPALQTVRADLVPALKDTGAVPEGRKRMLGRNALVVVQVALSLVLLVSAAVLYRGFGALLAKNPGFRTSGLLMMGFDPTLVKYTPAQAADFYKALLERARTVPGVRSAALTYSIPMGNEGAARDVVPEGHQFPQGQDRVSVGMNTVTDGYFQTMGMPVVRGRALLPTDTRDTPVVAVVNEAFAKKYWPASDALGKRFRLNSPTGPWVEIVGVTVTSKYFWIAEPPLPFFYLSLNQDSRPRMRLLAEAAGDPLSLVTPLRETIRSLDANQPVYGIRSMDEFYQQRAVATPMMLVQIVGAMGLLGLVLAMVGLYGLVSYSVSRRTREIGVRMAIGAGRSDVLKMVLGQGLRLGLIGALIGAAVSAAVVRVLANSMVGTGSAEPAVLIVTPLLLLGVTALATLAPARRASRIDPIRAVRHD